MAKPQNNMPLVMVVDDYQDGANMLGSLIKLWGYEHLVANDPRTAIALAKSESVSTFVLDIGLPEMDGYTLGGILKNANPTAIIIGNSAWNRDPKREQQEGFSFDFFLRKPFGYRELQSLLSVLYEIPVSKDATGLKI
jgi:CheY-like chemotaxis protein